MIEVIPHECSEGGYLSWAADLGRKHVCPNDGQPLTCLLDYIGGGSHYWTLQCPACEHMFYFDTYSFRLSEKQDVVAYTIEHGVTKLEDIAKL